MTIRNKQRADLKFNDFVEVNKTAEKGSKFNDFKHAWRNGGVKPDGSRMSMKDALAMWESPLYIPKIVNNAIQEAVEPLLIATGMLQKIAYQPGTMIDLPVMGAVDGDFDVGEEESFPELRVAYGPGSQIGKIGKQGVAVRFTEEVLRYSQFDVITMSVVQAGRALARNKEEKIFNMWYQVATTTHDNTTPAGSAFGTTTGRDLTGAQNGTITMDDVFEMFAAIMHNGYNPDMLLLHPLTWLMFVQDAQLRAFAQANQSAFFGSQWTGNPGRNDFASMQGGEGISGGAQRHHPGALVGNPGGTATADIGTFSNNLDSAPVLPFYAGMNFRVIVSPFVPYNATANTTTIMMADSTQLGFYVEDHPIQTTEWTDPETDILKIKLKERFTLRERNRGLGIAVAKNVVVAANQIVLPAQATIAMAGSIPALDRGTAV
tara:strand:+ start:7475 stop:8773 length:1299 start_codon:yes stop_codon:yes gene_type:complete